MGSTSLWRYQVVSEDLGGAERPMKLTVPGLPPSKWDGPGDADFYEVRFMRGGLNEGVQYHLDVSFTPAGK
jgi:hypothetical protein